MGIEAHWRERLERRRRVANATLAVVLCAPAATRATLVQRIELRGIERPVEILVDRWGVPHVFAQSEDDAFLGQGFAAARDRLFQIDLWRRRGLGRLAEVLGPAFVEQDRAARLFLYRGDMDAEWRAYSPARALEARRIATRFVAGINAYVEWLEANPGKLPWEFRRLGYKPSRWAPEDVVRIRSHGLTRNLGSEVARAGVACRAGLEADRVRSRLEPPWTTRVPEGLDPCLPAGVLRVHELATRGVRLSGAAEAASVTAGEPPGAFMGSNNWAIAPSRSATGRPILANDPHRAYSAPSLRYISHLSAPGLDVIGAGEPALPGISIGHNGRVAFGLTIFAIDQDDLYVYELDPSDPKRYRYRGAWEAVRTLREEVAVKDRTAESVELEFTRHGPLIFREPGGRRAFAVRSCWLEPGTAPYFGSVGYMRARDFASFKAALRHWGAPSENQVYADAAGNIGWVAAGRAPIRPNWDGLLPVPGDGRYEWAGFLSGDDLPHAENPPEGWLATANEMNLPDGYPWAERRLGFEWSNPARRQRIAEALAGAGKHSLEDSMRLQNDRLSIPARRLVALLRAIDPARIAMLLPSGEPDRLESARAARELLAGWDGVLDSDSAPAALHEVWISRHLGSAVKQALLSAPATDAFARPDPAVVLDALERPDARLGPGPAEARDRLLLESLARAHRDLESLLGAQPRQWRWGRLIHNANEHVLAPLADEATRRKLNIGPLPHGGSGSTVNAAGYRPSDFRQTGGPSFRMVIDVGHWDGSRAVNHPGQSGDPESPHYRDLAELWSRGEYFPLLYSRAAVEQETELRIELRPRR
jgi:penicillin amidase